MLVTVIDDQGNILGAGSVEGSDGRFSVPVQEPLSGSEKLVVSTVWAVDGQVVMAVLDSLSEGRDPGKATFDPFVWYVDVPVGGNVGYVTIDIEDGSGALFVFMMNKAKYDGLPADVKKAVDELSGETAARLFGRGWDKVDRRGLAFIAQIRREAASRQAQRAAAQAAPGVFSGDVHRTGRHDLAAGPLRGGAVGDEVCRRLADDRDKPELNLTPARRAWSRQQKHFHVPLRVEFGEREGGARTQLALVCSDRPGLLAHVAQAFRACGVRVHDARIATFGERVEDFFVPVSYNHLTLPPTDTV